MKHAVYRDNLVYPELCYRIIGYAYEVYNAIGGGHKEIVYQRAMEQLLKEKEVKYKSQIYYPVYFKEKVVGSNFFDFLIDEKVIVELKALTHFSKGHYDQVLNYLKVSKLKLALLIAFTSQNVRFKRVVNFEAHS